MSLLVFKIMKPSASFHGIVYNEKKKKQGKAALLHADNFRHLQEAGRMPSKAEAVRFMEAFCSVNTRIRNKQFHAILSCKGKSVSNEKLRAFGLEIIEKLGYGNNPVMIYGHNDTQHNHIHIITTRIGPDGKKIPHHFERKRSNEILQQIIGTDYKKEVAQDIEDVVQYHCSSVAQYQLLFEQKGYDTKIENDNLELFKYGMRQGNILITRLEEKMNQSSPANTNQIRALLYKYKKLHCPKLIKDQPGKYTTAKPRLQSELTEFLKQRFGLEFIFFTSKGHNTPYGYVVIDHNHKSVLKGSDIMKLQDLLQEQQVVKHTSEVSKYGTEKVNTDILEKQSDEGYESTHFIKNPFDKMINDIERDVERDVQNEEHTQKRRRGRFI